MHDFFPAPEETAFFLDYDGTLSDIVSAPDLAVIRPEALGALQQLQQAADGAVAVISGRSIVQLDEMLHPLRLPLAGVHGAERRNASGEIQRARIDPEEEECLIAKVQEFASFRPGLVTESKPGAVALHYRLRPDLEDESLLFAVAMSHANAGIHLVKGKKVIELKLSARTKGDAIIDFMTEAPFRGRMPFFAGDDATDEAGFAIVNGMGGVSLKVGSGLSAARYRVASIGALIDWLEKILTGWNARNFNMEEHKRS